MILRAIRSLSRTISIERAADVTILVFDNAFVTTWRHAIDKTFTDRSRRLFERVSRGAPRAGRVIGRRAHGPRA